MHSYHKPLNHLYCHRAKAGRMDHRWERVGYPIDAWMTFRIFSINNCLLVMSSNHRMNQPNHTCSPPEDLQLLELFSGCGQLTSTYSEKPSPLYFLYHHVIRFFHWYLRIPRVQSVIALAIKLHRMGPCSG